jgi:hypothetical protein
VNVLYVVLVNNDNTLYASKKERIIQKSKLFDKFWFLVHPCYKGYDMTNCTVLLEYLKPVSREYKTEILVLSKDKYEGYLKYALPIDTEFTKEAGTLELQVTFIYVDINSDGKVVQRVRKTSPTLKVEIIPISAWSNIIPDDALTALDQRIIKMDAQIKALDDVSTVLNDTKADNVVYENNKLQLTANGKRIGNSVDIKSSYDDYIKDGVPVVDFNGVTDFTTPDDTLGDTDETDNVVEF